MVTRLFKVIPITCILILNIMLPALAQQVSVNTGAVQGKVSDAQGDVIPGATVLLINDSIGIRREAKTNSDGVYSFGLLQPASGYRVEVEAQNFRRQVISDVVVRVTETTDANAQLTPGAASEEVSVTAGSASVQTQSAALGGTLTYEVISNLPIIDRNPLQLLATDAGVVSPPGSTTLFVNGNRSTFNNFQFNGADANNFEFGSLSSVATPNPDSIQEFRTQTSLYDATMGRGSGANITVISRSGTKEIHGNLLYLNRNSFLAANEFFLNRSGVKKRNFNRNHFGGSIGGPLPVGDQTFWFFNYEGSRQRNVAQTSGFYPVLPATRDARSLAAVFGVPESAIDPVAVALLNQPGPYAGRLFPQAEGPVGSLVLFSYADTAINNNDQFTARVDHAYDFWGKENRVSGTVFYSRGRSANPLGFGGQGSAFKLRNPVYTLQNTTIFQPTLLNELTLGANIGIRDGNNRVNPINIQDIGMSRFNSSIYSEIPTFQFAEGPSIGTPTNSGPAQHTPSVTVRDLVSYTRGKHNFRIGTDFRWYQFNYNQPFNVHGYLGFDPIIANALYGPPPEGVDDTSFRDFLIGAPDFIWIASGTPDRAFRAHDLSGFIQDDWRITPRLTLNFGLRYDYMANIYEKRNRNGNFDPALVPAEARLTGGPGLLQGFVFPEELEGFGTPGVPRSGLYGEDKNNWAPRISFAYDVFGNGKMAVRGGYGIYYIRLSSIPALQLTGQPPFAQERQSFNFSEAGILNNPFPTLPTNDQFPILPVAPSLVALTEEGFPIFEGGDPLFITAFERSLRTPYSQEWNLTTQFELFKDWIVELGYVGNHVVKMLNTVSINDSLLRNENNPGPFGLDTNSADNRDARVPFVGFLAGGITLLTGSAKSFYHSGQATVTHQFSKGFYVKGAYTWSKTIDNNSAFSNFDIGGTTGNQFLPDLNKSISDYDVPHRFVMTYVWNLPGPTKGLLGSVIGGWTTSGILTYQSGFPATLFQNTFFTSLSGNPGRGNQTPGCDIYTSGGNINNYLNKACVSASPTLTGGTRFGPLSEFEGPGDQFYTISPGGIGSLQGSAGRNTVRGPEQFRWDAGVYKQFAIRPLGERTSLEVRVEMFNVTNTPIFSNPNTTVDSLTFGRISSTSNIPRNTQVQLRLNF